MGQNDRTCSEHLPACSPAWSGLHHSDDLKYCCEQSFSTYVATTFLYGSMVNESQTFTAFAF